MATAGVERVVPGAHEVQNPKEVSMSASRWVSIAPITAGGVLLVAGWLGARRGVDEAEFRTVKERPVDVSVSPVTTGGEGDGQVPGEISTPEPADAGIDRPEAADVPPEDVETIWKEISHLAGRGETLPDLQSRRSLVMKVTVKSLGLQGGEEGRFETTALSAVDSINLAWTLRDREIVSLSELLQEGDRESRENEIQTRYEQAKLEAMGRLERALADRGVVAERLKERLGEWVDAMR